MAKLKDRDILEGYRSAEQLKPAQMARVLNIPRQSLSRYLKDETSPSAETVMDWFLRGAEDWVREMALEIYARRPQLERPCVCLEFIGDNGPCPRHAAVLVEEPAEER